MRFSGRIRLPNYAFALFLAPLLASALVAPARAETDPQLPAAQAEGTPRAAETGGNAEADQPKPNEAAEQPDGAATQAKPDGGAEQPNSDGATQTGSEPDAGKSAASPEPANSGSQILINVDKSSQHMTVFVDGIEKYSWPVSTGIRGYSTPSGNYTASSMNKIWYSKQWDNAPMPHSIFFTKDGHAIHGSHETKKLGRAASHGCVRLAPKNAATLFDLVKENGLENTKVVLAGVTPGGEAKVASQPRQYRDADAAPWMVPPGYYQRRGLFGWRQGPGWGPGYAPPPPRYYREQRRGWFQRPPRGYY
jgi:lipoprotein-anchoring transpeptidase ErfK/SrfK